jgi:NADPH:quinone reductase-like Zn-dependent oxidoreductase
MAETMRAMSVTEQGVQLVEVPMPEPSADEVLVRVVSSSVNAGEEKVLEGGLVGRFLHAKTTPLILGWDFSGTVQAVGRGVTDLAPGQPVWGHLEFSHAQTQGTYAEYVTAPRAELAIKPDDVPCDVAAAAPTVTMTSLQSLRDLGQLGPGNRLLIIGAGGGIGSVSVGIGHRLGAHVTAVCSTKDVERVEGLGPDVVLDRRETDPLTGTASYDVVFDTPGVYSFGRCARAITKGGAYVTTLPGPGFFPGLVRSMFSSKRCHFVQVASKRADLELVGEWLSGGLQVPIDSRFPVTELGAALSRQKDRGRAGRVVVDVADGWPVG